MFEVAYNMVSALAGFGVFLLVMVGWAWLDGTLAVKNVQRELASLVTVPSEISPFKCSGCDGLFLRGQLGYTRIGDGFEFCSRDCHEHPLPFPGFEESEVRLVS